MTADDARDPTEQVYELLERSERLDWGPERLGLVEEAVALADRHTDLELGFRARDELISVATFGGYPDKALVAFTWCLAQCDRDPERFDDAQLLWKYKWVAAHLPYFPTIPKPKILAVHDDMEARYRRAGQSLQPVYMIRWQAARRMGERAAARSFYQEAGRHERDWGSDCPACSRSDRVRYLLFDERPADALEAAAPILEGRLSCAEIPHATLAMVLLPLLRLGRREEALRCQRWGYRLIRGNRDFLEAVGAHLQFLTLTGNLAAGLEAFGEHAALAPTISDIDDRFHFLTGALVLFTRLAEEADPPDLAALRLPAELTPATPGAEGLRALLDAQVQELAGQFDRRNQTSAYADERREALARVAAARVDWPL